MQATSTKKTIWQTLKEIFWDCDNIGNDIQLDEKLRASQEKIDKEYKALNNGSKGGLSEEKNDEKTQGIVETVFISPKTMEMLTKKAQEKDSNSISEEQQKAKDMEL